MTPEDYIEAIETFLASNIGITSIRHPDGRMLTIDRKQAMSELAYWTRKRDASTPVFGRSRFGLIGDA